MLLTNRFFNVFRTAARGLEAQRIAMGTATENIANAQTSRTEDGTPYALKRAVHAVPDAYYSRFNQLLNRMQGSMQTQDARHAQGISLRRRLHDQELGPLTEVTEQVEERLEYDPSHPHADANGYVHYPDVNVVEEMARMISANRVYEANLASIKAAKEIIKGTLEI